jgi:hypothetical protein
MKLKDLETLKTGDTIYSFRDNNFYVYEVESIKDFPGVHEITVLIVSVNNVPDTKQRFYNIHVPFEEKYNTYQYSYEFTDISKDLNEAYQNYSERINREIRRLNGIRGNLKGLKRQYMLSKNMIPEHEKTWKELGYKSKEDYQGYLDDLYDDLRHGNIG